MDYVWVLTLYQEEHEMHDLEPLIFTSDSGAQDYATQNGIAIVDFAIEPNQATLSQVTLRA